MKKLFKKVINIDVDPVSRYLHELLIVEMGFAEEVVSITDAEAGLVYLENTWPVCAPEDNELILLELYMPEGGGSAFLEKLHVLAKKRNHPFYILVCSTMSQELIYKFPPSPFIVGWLEKPLTIEKLNSFFPFIQSEGNYEVTR